MTSYLQLSPWWPVKNLSYRRDDQSGTTASTTMTSQEPQLSSSWPVRGLSCHHDDQSGTSAIIVMTSQGPQLSPPWPVKDLSCHRDDQSRASANNHPMTSHGPQLLIIQWPVTGLSFQLHDEQSNTSAHHHDDDRRDQFRAAAGPVGLANDCSQCSNGIRTDSIGSAVILEKADAVIAVPAMNLERKKSNELSANLENYLNNNFYIRF